jgi:hypothetical protein
MPKAKEVLTPDEAKKKVEAAIEELVTLAQLHEKAVKASTKTSGKAQARAMRAAEETRGALQEAVEADRALFTAFTTSIKSPQLFDPPPPAGAKVTPIESKH